MSHRRVAPADPGTRRGTAFVSCSGQGYVCHPHHRDASLRRKKSQWAIPEDAECHVFCRAEVASAATVAAGKTTWYVANNAAEVFGANGERLARFLPPSAGATDWHGHPVGAGSPGRLYRKPPKATIAAWEKDAVISRAIAKKIRQEVL